LRFGREKVFEKQSGEISKPSRDWLFSQKTLAFMGRMVRASAEAAFQPTRGEWWQ